MFTDIVRNADTVLALVRDRHPALMPVARRFCLYQRLEYLLHIPISQMTPDNEFYRVNVVSYIRRHLWDILRVPCLTARNRVYLLILAVAPRATRTTHARLKGL